MFIGFFLLPASLFVGWESRAHIVCVCSLYILRHFTSHYGHFSLQGIVQELRLWGYNLQLCTLAVLYVGAQVVVSPL